MSYAARRRPRPLRALALFGGALAALAVNELAIGVVAPAFDPRQHVHFVDPDGVGPLPTLGEPGSVTRQVKNTGDYDVTVRINRYGFRDTKDIARAGPDDYVMVGDSFPFGWGVEAKDRMSDRLERLLGRPVYNVAVTGNFDDYQALLDQAAAKGAQIGKVIVCVTMESDIAQYGDAAPKTVEARPPTPPPAATPASGLAQFKAWLMRNSALYFVATTAVHGVPWLEALAVGAGLVVPNLEGIHDGAFDPAAIEASARRLARLAQRYRTTVVIIPSRALWHGGRSAEARRTHDTFVARLREMKLDVVDPRAAFERDGAPLAYHFQNDGHWKPRGHELVAALVAAHLRRGSGTAYSR